MAAELTGRLTNFSAHGVDVPSLVGVPSGLRLPAAPSVKAWSAVGDQGEVCPTGSGSSSRRVPWRAMVCTGNCSLRGFSCFIFSTFGSSLEFSLASAWRTAPSSVAGLSEGLTGSLAPLWLAVRGAAGPGYFLENFQEDGLTLRGTKLTMSLNRFLFVSRSVFMDPPFCWTKVPTYSARRVLPSIADVLGLSSTDRASLGTWAGSTSPSLADGSLRYSAVRSSSTLIIRGCILKCVLAARETGMAQDAAWDDLPLLFPWLVGPRRLPLATAAIVEEPTVGGTPDVYTALQDFDWFHGPSPDAVLHLVRRGRVLGLYSATGSGGVTAGSCGKAPVIVCEHSAPFLSVALLDLA